MDQMDIMKKLDTNVKRSSRLDVLMQVDEYLDNLNVYAYPNWFEGEIVDGPEIEKYWVTLTLMYPHKMMPDPAGAERIINTGGKVYFAKDTLVSAAKLKEPEDRADKPDPRRPGRPAAKKVRHPIWLVTLEIPRQFMDQMTLDRMDLEDTNVKNDDLEKAYNQDMGEDDVLRDE